MGFAATSGSAKNEEVIDTFRKVGNPATAEVLGSREVSSTHGKEEHTGSKSTFFESPYWPGQYDFRSRGLLDSGSSSFQQT